MNHTTKEQKSIAELKEVLHLDAVINTYVHGMIDNSSYKNIQEAFWAAMEAIQRQSNTIIEPIVYNPKDKLPEKEYEDEPESIEVGVIIEGEKTTGYYTYNDIKWWIDIGGMSAGHRCLDDLDCELEGWYYLPKSDEPTLKSEPIKDEELKDFLNNFLCDYNDESGDFYRGDTVLNILKQYAASLNNTVEGEENKKLREVIKLRSDLNNLHLLIVKKVKEEDFENATKIREEKTPIINKIISIEKQLGII